MIILRNLLFFSFFVEVFAFKLKNYHDFRTSGALFQIFKECKKDYDTITIHDNSKQLGQMWVQQLHEQFRSMIYYNESSRYEEDCFKVKKVDAILIILSSSIELEKIIDNLSYTRWWNVIIPVYILNLLDNDCEIAANILQQAWEHRILTSYFTCMENNEVQIYTYNPFTNRAPSSWTEVQRSSINSHWILYQQKYHTGIICQELDFDRTKHLGGYPITVVTLLSDSKRTPYLERHFNYNAWYPLLAITEPRLHFIIDALATTLNLRPDFYIIKKAYFRKRIRYTRIIEELYKNYSANLIFSDYYLLSNRKLKNNLLTLTYPLAWYNNAIATRNRGYRTLVEKVWDFYGIWIFLFTIFILIVTFAAIWFTERRRTAFSVFEIIRLLISQGLYTRMNTLPLRIFFITILLYFLIMQATFNGHLAEFLTQPELRRHPETKEDLGILGYTSIYNTANFDESYMLNANERIRRTAQVDRLLKNFVYNSTFAAGIFDRLMLLMSFKNSKERGKLYISQEPVEVEYTGFLVSKNWPLLNRVNWLLIFLEDLGFRQRLSENDLKIYLKHYQKKIETKSDDNFHPIEVENLLFSFWVLAVGLISATFIFCIELLINHKSKLNVESCMENCNKRSDKFSKRF